MRLGIMQPYFFPYLGHFSLISACDEWVVFDISQYARRSWMNRNRVLHPNGGWQWVSVPLAGASLRMRTHEARMLDAEAARTRILAQLSHYRRAPHYAVVAGLLDQAFDGAGASLVDLNVRALRAVCRHLELPFRCRVASALDLDLPETLGPGEWAPAICRALGATGYVNPESGQALFDPADFARGGIALQFLRVAPFAYRTGRFAFQPDLSILDVLMWNGREAVREALGRYTLSPPVSQPARPPPVHREAAHPKPAAVPELAEP